MDRVTRSTESSEPQAKRGPSKLAQAVAFAAALGTSFAAKQAIADTSDADNSPEARISIGAVTGNGLQNAEYDDDMRGVTITTTPGGSTETVFNCPDQTKGSADGAKGKWKGVVTNAGGFTEGEDAKQYTYHVDRQGDTGKNVLVVVSPDRQTGSNTILVECQPEGETNGEAEELTFVYQPRPATGKPGTAGNTGLGGGEPQSHTFGAGTFRNLIVGADLLMPIESVTGDGTEFGIGVDAYALKGLSDHFHMGVRLTALDVPADIKDRNGQDKVIERFVAAGVGEVGVHFDHFDAGAGIGYAYSPDMDTNGKTYVDSIHDPVFQLNAGFTIGKPRSIQARIGASLITNGHDDDLTIFTTGLGIQIKQ